MIYTQARIRPRRYYRELERLICRAVCEEAFAQQLMNAPDIALREHAKLSAEEHELLISINAVDIHDFAAKLHAKLYQLGVGEA